ncbi:hypothetical protein LJC57_08195 [Parabacteroides sp. OttesenSCG-928-G07]|nr:hypothetical protein [Parabacteroides sp. OttesenSCG-928-G21]MDL2278558.1 hypothetical protein [Parabacteroides sp. OttesenSCG-928-G07]
MFAESYTEEILSYRHSDAFEFHITTTDTLYHFDVKTHRFHPVFTMINTPVSTAERMWCVGYYELPDRFLTTFWAYENNKNTEIRAFSTDKDSQTSFSITKFVNDFYGGIELPLTTFNKGYFIHNVEPGELMDIIDKRLTESDCTEQDRELLTQLLSTLDENSNNLLFVGKLKQ